MHLVRDPRARFSSMKRSTAWKDVTGASERFRQLCKEAAEDVQIAMDVGEEKYVRENIKSIGVVRRS